MPIAVENDILVNAKIKGLAHVAIADIRQQNDGIPILRGADGVGERGKGCTVDGGHDLCFGGHSFPLTVFVLDGNILGTVGVGGDIFVAAGSSSEECQLICGFIGCVVAEADNFDFGGVADSAVATL